MSGEWREGDGDCGGNVAPFVLGALTASEHEAFLVHLESCAVCREEVAALQSVAAALPAAAPQLSAPPEVKRRVMSAVREDTRNARAAAAAQERERKAGSRPRWRGLLAPAALGVAVVVVLAIVLGRGGGGGGASTRVIRAEVRAPGASGFLRVSGGRAVLTLAKMPPTSLGRVYELWVKRAGAAEPTDELFTVTAHGDATVGVPGDVSGVRTVMVTSEPLGGSRAPTSAPAVIANL